MPVIVRSKNMLIWIMLFCVSVTNASVSDTSGFDNFLLNAILRNTRSEINDIDNWQHADTLNNDNYIVADRSKYHNQKAYGRRKASMALNLYHNHSFKFKERVEKKNNINNNNIQKFVLCHFKICNMPMGKRKTRFLHHWDMISIAQQPD